MDPWMPDRIAEILDIVGIYFGFGRAEILARCRSKTIARARLVAIRIAREEGYSFPELGRAFGGRDHTSMMSACRRVALACSEPRTDPLMADAYFACLHTWLARKESLYGVVKAEAYQALLEAV